MLFYPRDSNLWPTNLMFLVNHLEERCLTFHERTFLGITSFPGYSQEQGQATVFTFYITLYLVLKTWQIIPKLLDRSGLRQFLVLGKAQNWNFIVIHEQLEQISWTTCVPQSRLRYSLDYIKDVLIGSLHRKPHLNKNGEGKKDGRWKFESVCTKGLHQHWHWFQFNVFNLWKLNNEI